MMFWTNAREQGLEPGLPSYIVLFPSLIIVLLSVQFVRLISRKIIFTIWEIRGLQSFVCNLSICHGVFLELCNGIGWKVSLVFKTSLVSCGIWIKNRILFENHQNRQNCPPSSTFCGSVLVLEIAVQCWGPTNLPSGVHSGIDYKVYHLTEASH